MPMRDKEFLNGWWDFLPVPHDDITTPLFPDSVPADGWNEGAYLVPGFFTDHPYPEEWRGSRSGWAKRSLVTAPPTPGYRAFLTIRGAIPMAQVFVNGTRVAVQEDMFIGDALDITDHLRDGANELAVFITEFKTFPHPDSGKPCLIDVPWGCCIAGDQAGIWQDVELEWRPPVHVTETVIVTSTRNGSMRVTCSVANTGDTGFEGTLHHGVEGDGPDIPPVAVSVPAGGTAEATVMVPWSDHRAWCPEDPHLYHLVSRIVDASGATIETVRERFGFREVWIEGHRVVLNGVPQRWAGEWCHKSHSHWLRPEYVRQWYRQIKDLNCSYVRMHTFPHPEHFLDIADEMGIIVCQETALHGSGQSGWDTPELWPRFEAHIHRMVRRDRNHPSLVIWSVENEMRWSLNIVPGAKTRLQGYRGLFNRLDPTRPAYHDGDTSLWNEDEQPIISRHYGPACHGMGWWDKGVPLHSGEIGRWHYASPYHALQFKGDEVFTDYALLSESLAMDCARIIELGRANGVTCLFFWNTSGLDNFRPAEAKSFTWDDPSSPGLKPLAHKPYESEYAWWEEGKGYREGWSFQRLREALRPLAIIVREERRRFYAGSDCPHTVWLVNDASVPVEGDLTVSLVSGDGGVLWSSTQGTRVERGMTGTVATGIPIPAGFSGDAAVRTVFTDEATGMRDTHERTIAVSSPQRLTRPLGVEGVYAVGATTLMGWLASHGVGVTPVEWDGLPELPIGKPLVVAESSIEGDPGRTDALNGFLSKGGNALILEQKASPFTGVGLGRMPVETAFIRDAGHPVTRGLTDDDLRFWGDDPFGMPSSRSWVVVNPFIKPRGKGTIRPIIDSSGGDFGTGGLQWAPVVEAKSGKGTAVAVQLRVSDRWDAVPAIDTLLGNALEYLAALTETVTPSPLVYASQELLTACPEWAEGGVMALPAPDSTDPKRLRELLDNGATLVVSTVTPETSGFWSAVAGCGIEAREPEAAVHHAIATGKHPLLRGLSNEDTCYMDNWTYKSNGTVERMVDHLLDVGRGSVLLTNSDRSGLDTLFGQGNATEWKRMPALSAYFDGPRPRVGAVMAEVPVGQGRLVLLQARVLPGLWQFGAIMSQLGLNLGLDLWSDAMEGGSTPAPPASEGYPGTIRVLASPTPEEEDEAISLSKRRMESYAGNDPFRRWERWAFTDCPGGAVAVGTEPVLLGMEVVSPEPRKFMETIGGLPSPDLQTFLRVSSHGPSGTVMAWVNGKAWGQCPVTAERPGTITDIDLEDGSNFVLLRFTPDDPGEGAGKLALRFENKDRSPETGFSFA